MCFSNEKSMVDSFVTLMSTKETPWGAVQVATEFYYQRGRTDIVAQAADDSVIAVEAKLKNWRAALQQAFRNRCFADVSYVLLPKNVAEQAHRYSGEFDRRKVGICYLESSGIVVLHSPQRCLPFEPWLSIRAKQHIESFGATA